MQFQVPQFIEREARVVGPLTFKQFIYVGIAIAFGFLMYFTLPFTFFIAGALCAIGIGSALAFFSVGGRSLPFFILGFLAFSLKTKTYVWKKGKITPTIMKSIQKIPMQELPAERLSLTRESKMKNLSTKLDGR